MTRRAQHPRGYLQNWTLRDRWTTSATATAAAAASAVVAAAALHTRYRGYRRGRFRLALGHFALVLVAMFVSQLIYLFISLSVVRFGRSKFPPVAADLSHAKRPALLFHFQCDD